MAQNITLMGANYSAVPGVQLPKTGGGTALFTDVTDTTAAAADVATGKYFYTAAGVRTEGTNAGGGGGSVSQDAQGYIVLPSTGGSDYNSALLTITNITPDFEMDIWIMGCFIDRDNDMLIPAYTINYGTAVTTLEVALFKGQSFITVDGGAFVSCSGGITHTNPGSPDYIVTGNASLVLDTSDY